MSDLIQHVLAKFKETVHGFIPPAELTPIHYVFEDAAPDGNMRQELLSSSQETFRVLIAEGLFPKQEALQSAPDQYQVLARMRSGVPIVNYNIDQLASVHCRSAKVLPVHGELPDFVGRMRMKEVVRLTQEGIEIIPESSFWLPEREAEEPLLAVLDPAYRTFLEISQLVIIGYSFGLGSNGIMDKVSFNALVEYCGCRDIPITVVDPFPRNLAECLADSLKNETVTQIPAYWNLLSTAILNIIRDRGLTNLDEVAGFGASVVREYRQLLDRRK